MGFVVGGVCGWCCFGCECCNVGFIVYVCERFGV